MGEQDASFGLFLGPNYINIEMSVTTFSDLIFKTKLRKLFLKKVSDIIDDNSLFSLNNADIETAKLAVKAELRKLEQNNLEMVEMDFMCSRLKILPVHHVMYHHVMYQPSFLLFFMISQLIAIALSSSWLLI